MIELGKYNTKFVVHKRNVKQLTYRDPSKWENIPFMIGDMVEFKERICEVKYVGIQDLVLTLKEQGSILINI